MLEPDKEHRHARERATVLWGGSRGSLKTVQRIQGRNEHIQEPQVIQDDGRSQCILWCIAKGFWSFVLSVGEITVTPLRRHMLFAQRWFRTIHNKNSIPPLSLQEVLQCAIWNVQECFLNLWEGGWCCCSKQEYWFSLMKARPTFLTSPSGFEQHP